MKLSCTFNVKWLLAFLLFNLLSLRASAQGFMWAQGFVDSMNDDASINTCITDGNNNGYFVGSFSGTVDFDPGLGVMNVAATSGYDMFILKKDPSGNLLWMKLIQAMTADTGMCFVSGIGLDGSGNIYISGSFSDSFDFDPGPGVHLLSAYSTGNYFGRNAYVLKLNPSGDFIWVKDIGSQTNLAGVEMRSMKMDAAANIFFTCSFSSNTPCTIDVDPGIGVYNVPCQTTGDFLLEKLDSAGNFIWAKLISGPGNQSASALAIDKMSNIYITGKQNGTADFDPDLGVANLSGSDDIFIAKYDSAGNYQWAGSLTGGWNDNAYSIATDTFDNVIVTGYLELSTADFDMGLGVHTLTEGPFVLKLRSDGSFAWAKNDYAGPGWDIVADGQGNIYTSQAYEPFIQKMDSTGNVAWLKSFGTGGLFGVGISAITLDHANDIYVAGGGGNFDADPGPSQFYLPNGGDRAFIVKLCGESLTKTVSNDTICPLGDTAVLSTPFIPGANYTWTMNNVVITGANTNTIIVNINGIYEVYVDGGCPSASGSIFIYDCNGSYDTQTGIAETVKGAGVEVYPNPTDDKLTIETTLTNYNLTILNTLGQVVERRTGERCLMYLRIIRVFIIYK